MQLAAYNGINLIKKHATFIFICAIALLVFLTILQDRIEADLQGSSFYFSESFLFSSFWWIFLPFLWIQFSLIKGNEFPFFRMLLFIPIPVMLHLIAYPGLVWLISGLFYENTFRFGQTFQYAVSEYLILLIVVYALPVMLMLINRQKKNSEKSEPAVLLNLADTYNRVFIVSEGSRRISIPISEIDYFSANPPYISIHHNGKRYLYNQTLKSITEKIDPEAFIRIHKSTIVNIREVRSYTSRLNGDYDLTLKSGTCLRVSRNYAAAFKSQFYNTHQDTTK